MPTAEMWAPAKKKKIVGTAHTFFIKFLGAHNTHTPTTHPSTQLAPSALAGVGLSLDPEGRLR